MVNEKRIKLLKLGTRASPQIKRLVYLTEYGEIL